MKFAALFLTLMLAAPIYARAQASDLPSAAPTLPSGQTQEQRGRILLDQMIAALGGDAWLHRKDMTVRGRSAAFFRGAPNGSNVEYSSDRQFAHSADASQPGSQARPEAERIGFITDKSMFFPGKKIDVVQIWVDNQGYEVTYKGRIPLPKEQVEDYFRRRNHSIENVVTEWLKQPGVVVIAEGNSMVERRMAEKLTILSANNDAVTIELEASTHLPLRRTFEWRNTQFKDHDEDVEEYDDYHTIQGLPTPMTLTRYHNGDMNSQRFYTRVEYNSNLSPALFNPDNLLKKKQ
jgi:hypothetical protein